MRVTKTFTFHAAHRDMCATDQCGRLHGHTYRLELTVEGEQEHDSDMLLHGDVLKEIYRERIEPYVEHRYLNETLPFNPTMESVAQWCQTRLVDGVLHRDRVTHGWQYIARLWETPTMHATAP